MSSKRATTMELLHTTTGVITAWLSIRLRFYFIHRKCTKDLNYFTLCSLQHVLLIQFSLRYPK